MTKEITNLALWDKVKKTDPKHTKEFSGPGGYSGTAINPTYLTMLATENWGPIGMNWGYNILEERFETGHPQHDEAGEILGHITTHTIKLELWVKNKILDPNFKPDEGEDPIARICHFGHTPCITWNRTYKNWVTDVEAPKKSLTDALKKCLSMYGFSADIFLGMYDDVNYVAEVKAQADIDDSEDKLAEGIKQRQEYKEWFDKHIEFINTATNINELELLFKTSYRKAQHKGDRDGLLKLTRAKDAKMKTLKEKK